MLHALRSAIVLCVMLTACHATRQATQRAPTDTQVYAVILDSLALEYEVDRATVAVADSTIVPPFAKFTIYMALPAFNLEAYADEYDAYKLDYQPKPMVGSLRSAHRSSPEKLNLFLSNVFRTHDDRYAIVYVETRKDIALFGSGRFLLLEKTDAWRIVWDFYTWKG